MEEINKSVKPIIERERTKEDRSADIGELKGVLSAAKAAGLSKVIISVPVRLLAIDTYISDTKQNGKRFKTACK